LYLIATLVSRARRLLSDLMHANITKQNHRRERDRHPYEAFTDTGVETYKYVQEIFRYRYE